MCYKVVRMTGELFHGGEDMVGTMTSGNYKSINQATRGYTGFNLWKGGGNQFFRFYKGLKWQLSLL